MTGDAGEALISLEISGGYTGQITRLELRRDGAARVQVGGRTLTGRVDPEQVDGLLGDLESVPAEPLPAEPAAAEPVTARQGPSGAAPKSPATAPGSMGAADLRSYQVHFGGRTLTADDASVPRDLSEPLRRLEELVRAVQLDAARGRDQKP